MQLAVASLLRSIFRVRSTRYFLIPALTAAVAAPLAALAYTAAHAWWDLHDVPTYAGWTIPLAVACGALSAALRSVIRGSGGQVRWTAAAAVGGALGLLWSYTAALLLGGWIFGFGFPVLYCWVFGGVAAGLSAAVLARREASLGTQSLSLRGLALRLVGIPVAVVASSALLYVGLMSGSVHVWNRAQHEVHLIPADYRGPVIVIFNDSTGAAKEYEGRARLYRIPPSGILRTQFARNDGWARPDYYYVDAQGRRSRIVPGAPCDDALPGDSVQACLMGQRMQSSANGATQIPVYSGYTVGRRAERRDTYDRGNRVLDSLFAPETR
jgi:hypothetical protein